MNIRSVVFPLLLCATAFVAQAAAAHPPRHPAQPAPRETPAVPGAVVPPTSAATVPTAPVMAPPPLLPPTAPVMVPAAPARIPTQPVIDEAGSPSSP